MMPVAAGSQQSERSPAFTDSVFINCPFDREYAPIFEAIVFCVVACGFVPRCALEAGDSGTVRLDKIRGLIAGSRFAVHDLSRLESGRHRIAGGEGVARRFSAFTSELPSLANRLGLSREDLQFVEYVAIAEEWLRREEH